MTNVPATPWGGGPTVRYTFDFTLVPSERVVRQRAVTAFGAFKAAYMAGSRVASHNADSRILKVELVAEETDFVPDNEHDVISYHEVA